VVHDDALAPEQDVEPAITEPPANRSEFAQPHPHRRVIGAPVCAEILIRFIWPTESPNVGLGCLRCYALPHPILLAIQVEEPT
jgi:hypothetical protein